VVEPPAGTAPGLALGVLAFVGLIAHSFRMLARMRKLEANGGRVARTRNAVLYSGASAALVAYCAAGFFVSAAYAPVMFLVMSIIMGIEKVAEQTVVAVAAPAAVTTTYRIAGMRGGAARSDYSI